MNVHDEQLLRQHVATPWTPDRARIVQTAMVKRMRRARNTKVVLGALVTMLVASGGVWWTQVGGKTSPDKLSAVASLQVQPQPQQIERSLPLDADATVLPLDPQQDVHALVRLVDTSASVRTFRLMAAGARFEVQQNHERRFRLQVDSVAIEVLGGTFVTSKVDGDVRVAVERQTAWVSWPGGSRALAAGQTGVFPMKAPRAGRDRWQKLAKRGQFDEAFSALQQEISVSGSHAVPDEPGALLLAADAARLSRHPQKALPHLQRFVNRFPSDPRASLAAFTLGLVLLEELGRPRDAAEAFSKSRKLAPSGDLTEDAWAREAEASFRAGDADRARAAAQTYLQRFPGGRRASAVKRYGAIE